MMLSSAGGFTILCPTLVSAKKTKQKPPRAAAPAAACVAGRSTGQHMPPQQPSKQTATAPRPLCVVPKLRLGMRPAKLRFAFPPPQPPSKQTATASRPQPPTPKNFISTEKWIKLSPCRPTQKPRSKKSAVIWSECATFAPEIRSTKSPTTARWRSC